MPAFNDRKFYGISRISKLKMPFTDKKFLLKKAFIDCAKELYSDFKNKKDIFNRIKEIFLSVLTV